MHSSDLCFTFVSLALLSLGGPAAAQAPALSHYGEHAGDGFGAVIEVIGDVNGDGIRDFAVGSPQADATIFIPFAVFIEEAGTVSVYSGASGDPLWSIAGPLSGGTEFGSAIASTSDIDGDGHLDVLVGAPSADGYVPGSGMAQLFSGASGALLRTFRGSQTGERYGDALCSGHLDFDFSSTEGVIGAPWHDLDDSTGGLLQEGRVEIVQLATGAVMLDFPGTPYSDPTFIPDVDVYERRMWGAQIEYIGDHDNDGYGAVAISAPFTNRTEASPFSPSVLVPNTGLIRAFEPFDLPVVPLSDPTWKKGNGGDLLGLHLAALSGDANGDGAKDWAAYEPGGKRIRVYSGIHYSVFTTSVDSLVGLGSLAGVGDANGDGIPDIAAGIPGGGADFGSVRVLSGASGLQLDVVTGPAPGDRFGNAVAGRDMDGDGASELWVGARADDTFDTDAGAVYIFSDSDCLAQASWETYGTGVLGTQGIPALSSTSTPKLGSTFSIDVESAAAVPAAAGMLIGLQEASVPILGGTMLVLPFDVQAFTLDTIGTQLDFNIPSGAVFCGLDVFMQVLHVDANAIEGWAFTPGMKLTLGS